MTNPRQKSKRRSSRPVVRAPSTNPRRRRSKKLPHPTFSQSDQLVARNWDTGRTLRQNYTRMGLAGRLGPATGGVERGVRDAQRRAQEEGEKRGVGVREVRVKRDEEGRIVRVGDGERDGNEIGGRGAARRLTAAERRFADRGLRDPLNNLDGVSCPRDGSAVAEDEFDGFMDEHASNANLPAIDGDVQNGSEQEHTVVGNLEASALQLRSLPRRKRRQSAREKEWVGKLVAKYGRHNVAGMARDSRLNVMQQSEGDIRRRVGLYLERPR